MNKPIVLNSLKSFTGLVLLVFVLYSSAFSQEETLRGHFELNQMLNQYKNSQPAGQKQFRQMLETANIPLIEAYITNAQQGKFEVADSLLRTDENLSRMPQRMVILLYDYYRIDQENLLDYHCLVQEEKSGETTNVVFVTEKQLEKLRAKLGKETELKVQPAGEARLTGLKFYKLM